MKDVLLQSELPSLNLLARGKVRDIYDLGNKLLIVATDRISAFDYILPNGIPHKGKVLTKISRFWMEKFASSIENHLLNQNVSDFVASPKEIEQIKDRSEVVKKAKPLPVELIVRGYITGSGFKDYLQSGQVCGIKLPAGLQEAQKLPEPIFTPSTKAAQGEHDENISYDQMVDLIGEETAQKARDICLNLYHQAAEHALSRGIIIADTKMELGWFNNELILIDEVFTPDSSRFWPVEHYEVGKNPPSFDKQFVRDYLNSTDWDKNSEPPVLPQEIIEKTAEKYQEAFRLLTK